MCLCHRVPSPRTHLYIESLLCCFISFFSNWQDKPQDVLDGHLGDRNNMVCYIYRTYHWLVLTLARRLLAVRATPNRSVSIRKEAHGSPPTNTKLTYPQHDQCSKLNYVWTWPHNEYCSESHRGYATVYNNEMSARWMQECTTHCRRNMESKQVCCIFAKVSLQGLCGRNYKVVITTTTALSQ